MSQGSTDHKDQLLQLFQSVAAVAGFVPPGGSHLIENGKSLLPYIWQLNERCGGLDAGLVEALDAHLAGSNLALSPLLKIRLVFAQVWFGRYLESLNLEPETLEWLCGLRPAFIARALCDDDLFVHSCHQFGVLLQRLSQQLPLWYSGQGRAAEKTWQNLQNLSKVLLSPVASSAVVDGAIVECLSQLEKEQARAQVQSQRCAERERAELQLLRSRAQVDRHFSGQLVGRQLPEFVDTFLREPLLAELQLVLINHGEQHPHWLQWKRVMVLLARMFAADASPEHRIQDTEVCLAALAEPFELMAAPQVLYEDFLAELTALLFSMLQGAVVETVLVAPLSSGADTAIGSTQVSRALLRQVATIREGDWFLLESESGEIIRCKLLLKLIDVQRLIFVNSCGFKVAEKNVDDFAFCLSSRLAVPLLLTPIFEACSVHAVSHLRDIYDRNLERHQAEQQRLAAIEAKQQAEAAAEQKVRQLAAEKARREAEALAERERVYELELKERRRVMLADKESQAQAKATELIDSLKVGAWLELTKTKADDEPLVRAKLAVTLPSTGKHIFVDRIGLKLAEYQREDLIDMLLLERLRVISHGDSFESQLSKVVKGLRKDVRG